MLRLSHPPGRRQVTKPPVLARGGEGEKETRPSVRPLQDWVSKEVGFFRGGNGGGGPNGVGCYVLIEFKALKGKRQERGARE